VDWLTATKIPVGAWARDVVDWLIANGAWFFDGLANIVNALIDAILWVLQTPHPLIVVAAFAALAWVLQRSWWIVALVVLGFLFIINQRYWEETTETLTLCSARCWSAWGSACRSASPPGTGRSSSRRCGRSST
jgi:glycine betaine/proline transport system permease protein